jgi:hypothetical protein
MSDHSPGRLAEIVKKLYGERISNYARGSEFLEKDAIAICMPAVVTLTLPEQYASVVLTSRMDNELRKLLERTLHRQGDPDELLFEYLRPFGTFSAKINAAFSFGLMTKKMYDAITSCRKIRNAYSHADNPDEARESKNYKTHSRKLLNLDTVYVTECVARLHTLREQCKDALVFLSEFSEISGVMLGICEHLGTVAFYASPSISQKLRFPCAFFGPDDAPPLGNNSTGS